MKKCIGLLVALCLICSLAVPAFASDYGDGEQVPAVLLDDATRENLMDIPIFLITSEENWELTNE